MKRKLDSRILDTKINKKDELTIHGKKINVKRLNGEEQSSKL